MKQYLFGKQPPTVHSLDLHPSHLNHSMVHPQLGNLQCPPVPYQLMQTHAPHLSQISLLSRLRRHSVRYISSRPTAPDSQPFLISRIEHTLLEVEYYNIF